MPVEEKEPLPSNLTSTGAVPVNGVAVTTGVSTLGGVARTSISTKPDAVWPDEFVTISVARYVPALV